MKSRTAALLITWAVGATLAAVFFGLREPLPPASTPDTQTPAGAATQSELEAYAEHATRRLRQRLDRMRFALETVLPKTAAVPPAVAEGEQAEPSEPPAERVLRLMDDLRQLQQGDTWTAEASHELYRRLHALISRDASTHLALMQQLGETSNEDEALDVLELLVDDPFSKLITRGEVTESIRADARRMLDDAKPHVRAAAPRVLFGYRGSTLDDVLLGIDRLQKESDPDVWDALLGELSVAAKGHGLTVEQAQPLIDGLRQRSSEDGGEWAAGALAQWSADDADLAHVVALLEAETDEYAAQDILNALERDRRLASAHVDEARTVLIGVIQDRTRHELVRGMALDFLRGYAPWDADTAEVARRHEQR
jgi:hypothetical protein